MVHQFIMLLQCRVLFLLYAERYFEKNHFNVAILIPDPRAEKPELWAETKGTIPQVIDRRNWMGRGQTSKPDWYTNDGIQVSTKYPIEPQRYSNQFYSYGVENKWNELRSKTVEGNSRRNLICNYGSDQNGPETCTLVDWIMNGKIQELRDISPNAQHDKHSNTQQNPTWQSSNAVYRRF